MTRRAVTQDRTGVWRSRAGRPAGARNRSIGAQAAQLRQGREHYHLFMHGGVSHVDTFDPKRTSAPQRAAALSRLAKTIKTSFIHDPTKAILRGSRGPSGPAASAARRFPICSRGCASAWTTSPSSAAALATRSITRLRFICVIPARSFRGGPAWGLGSSMAWALRIRTCHRSW